jgi:alginate O-acetyltransferase complex protein AlgI
MLFHTWIFVAFFAVVYPVYLAVKGTRFREPWLLLASCVFYAWWNPQYLTLVVYATLVDYVLVMLMARTTRPWLRRLCLLGSIGNNILLLSQFKYAAFLIDGANATLGWLGASWVVPPPSIIWPIGFQTFSAALADGVNYVCTALNLPVTMPYLGLLLPVGISFHTFQSMSYTIDFYRGGVEKEPSFIRYATFVMLFPQLVAGPIERARNLLPQLRAEAKIRLEDITDGASLFLVGLFKKIALADFLALYVDKVYSAPANYQAPALALATFAFAWQIYFDFSGYTDMARGIARMMGFRLMLNFNNPYLATGLGDFWARWHISLSSWFKDYVYIPLGGNRGSWLATYRNMFLTMVISGLWHGASWTFVIWGVLHAVGRMLTRELERTAFYRDRVPRFVKQAWVFAFVCLAWVFFRAHDLDDAWLIVSRILAGVWSCPAVPALAAGLAVGVLAYQPGRKEWVSALACLGWMLAFATAAGLIAGLLGVHDLRAILQWIFWGGWTAPAFPPLAMALVLVVWAYQFLHESAGQVLLKLTPVRVALAAAMILYLAFVPGGASTAFIYFQF